MSKKIITARFVATQVLTQVLGQKRSLSDSLDNYLPQLTESRDRAFAQAICYETMRWLPRLEAILKKLLKKPLKAKESDIHALLLIGLCQQIYLHIPEHAAIAATVDVIKQLDKIWAKGLVNAVLRNFQRQRTTLLAEIDQKPAQRLAHPDWILKRLQTDWSKDWEAIATANNAHPPMTLRINQRYINRDDYLTLLQDKKIEATLTPHATEGMTLNIAVDVQQLPSFAAGQVSVQDGAAQLAAILLDVPENAIVLDACAAPGGKTAHILEKYNIKKLVAIDNQVNRVAQLKNTLERLQLHAEIHCADITQSKKWWDGQLFDRILLDVPCSASGVIRRHPDIKFLRQPSDIKQLEQQQSEILKTAWDLLAPNGKLLYVTCSVFAQENYLQLQKFMAIHQDAQEVVIDANWGHAQPIGRQILPCDKEGFDGFYYACLAKTA